MTGRTPRALTAVVALVTLAFAVAACTPPPPASVQIATPVTSVGTTSTTLAITTRLMDEARQFAYRVRNVDCDVTGSSFATEQGIVTNRHVASGASSLELSTWDGTDFNASVQSISEQPAPDLAILAGGSTQVPATLSTSDVSTGTQVWAAGYPEGNQLSLSAGIVLDYISGSVYGAPGQIMELTNDFKPGNSGSPLLDGQGNVVGVVFALNTVTGNGLAIPVSDLAQFLSSPGEDTFGNCAA
jgi:S1-C subfamily serine protease